MSVTRLPLRRVPARRFGVKVAVVALLLGSAVWVLSASPAGAANPCGPPVTSVIACENLQPGDQPSDWQVNGVGDATIQGFATSMSMNVGETESFKINNTSGSSYHIDILRVGYYQGNGARKLVSNMAPTGTQSQPACLNGATGTGLIDCGNWSVSASWAVPSTAVSGLYLAHLVRNDNRGSSLIPFVVRNDAGHSDIVVQTSDETWQAYNTYGGNSLYTCTVNCPSGSPTAYKGASKVSYNRPFHTALDDSGRSWFMYAEYDMIRFLEENGYDVSYMSGLDVGTRGSLLLNHKIFLSSAHDEYWAGPQRANVEAARDAGVNLAFFSGNEVFWKTRWESSIDPSNTPNRTLVAYKETHYDAPVDPQDPPTWTGTWMDPRFSPPADGGRPQNALTGQLFVVNSNANTTDITVPAQYAKLRFWRGTRVASLNGQQSTTLDQGVGTLGYEWDEDADNGYRPAGLIDMSTTVNGNAEDFTDYGGTTQMGSTATHHLTLYRAPSGALVFGAGTVQWAWGLDNGGTSNPTDSAMQQATVNLFADMGNVQPASIIAGLTPATTTSDTTAPTSTITSPSQGANLSNGSAVTISGSATDVGGVVAGVEVSTDGGTTWHPVTTMSNPNSSVTWTYSWVAHGSPSTVIMSRAVDDSGNLQSPPPGTTVNMACPCSIWGPAVAPKTIDSGDAAATEVGVKFKVDSFGYVTGIRFYKATGNTGTHIGNLWSSNGQLLASATFNNESASGWQQVNFAQPVSLNKNTTYIASYFAPRGHYSGDDAYFYTTPELGPAPTITNVDSPPLHAVRNSGGVTNGVFSHSGTSTFPTSSNDATNYYVDPVFTPQTFTTPPGPVGNVNATAGFASATVSWSAPTTGDPATAYTITPYIGSAAQTATTVPGNPAPTTAAVSGLTNGTTYTFTVTASNPAGTGPESAQSNAVTPSSSALHVTDGDFENGLTGWTAGGVVPPTATGTQVHSGSGAALLGTVQPTPTPSGDSNLSQSVAIPPTGTTTLTFWYRPSTADDACSGSGCVYDWQEAQVQNTAGQTLASIFKSNSNSQTWTKVTFDMTPYAGQNVMLWFNVHQDASANPDDTWLYLDDVTLSQPALPGAPTGVTATAGNGSATVSWAAPSDNGGSAITKYTVTPFIGSTAQTPVTVTGNPPATSTTVTGLTNGTTYTFTVSATNATGTGPASSPSNAVTPNALPGAPTGVTATAGNGSATVSWTAPSNNGGSTITKYTVTPYVGSTAQTPVTVTGNPPATSTTVTGLTNGTTYTFTVSATNANGTGPESSPSNAVTPSGPTLPGAPTGVTATAGNGSATVSWTAPANTGGSAITTYTVTPFIGSTAQTPATVTGNPPATTTTVSGLTNGTTYTFTVSATNATGTGPASSPSNAVTPNVPPTVTSVAPSAGATGVAVSVAPAATFSQAVVPNTVSFTLKDSGGNAVAGLVTFNGANTVATFTPTNSLSFSTTYIATVSGAQNSNGTPMSSPFSWNFTTSGPQCPCSVWQNGTPSGAVDATDTSAVNLGLQFQTSGSGFISSVRFYKYSDNIGTHTGSLWTASGTLLASGTFSGESASGWQELDFANPVAVTAGTTYVASYHTDAGHYALTSSGLTSAVTNGPLTALANGGVYAYGSGNVFPSNTFNASNYWVDVVYSQSAGSTPPTVTGVSPSDGATGVAVSVTPTATFSQAVVPNTVSFTLKDSGGTTVPGSVTFNGANTVATFTPTNSLAASTAYTATVSGAQNSSGTPMSSPFSWSFTTGAVALCPCSIWQNGTPSGAVDAADTSSVNLGLQFQASSSGFIAGVRFYKETDNTGSHTGSLWTASGTLLASGTFSGESASGWQELDFSSPVAITAGTTYVASYHTDAGHYAQTSSGLASAVTNGPLTALASGGVYAYDSGNVFPSNTFNASNYWVDVVYSQSAGSTPPAVTGVTPSSGATGVAVSIAPTATFNQAVVPNTVSFTLKDSGGTTVPGSVTFNGANTVATFTPTNSLAASTAYTATVSGARNSSGTPMSSPFSWTFTTGTVSQCPCSIWNNAAPSGAVDAADTSAVNLGLQFQASSSGRIIGVRFYKESDNTGTHTGSLWTASGTLLATGTFSGESASGWQELDFSSPVAITAGTTYVASYHTDAGHYALTSNGLTSAVTNGPLTALARGGVYAYGSGNVFPSNTFRASNYWVDVVYSP
jgi:Domain of unknown function (DUF4082)/Bacterial Ig-like domain/Fibronectin type III domain/Bacterial Ig domain